MRYNNKIEALALRNRLKAKVVFAAKVQGIVFEFEKRACEKDYLGRPTGRWHRASFIGSSNFDKLSSRRVGLCKHLIEGFDVNQWEEDPHVSSHIKWMWERAGDKIRRAALFNAVLPRKGDGIYEEKKFGEIVHGVRITNLTREQAIHIYQMADAIIGESE